MAKKATKAKTQTTKPTRAKKNTRNEAIEQELRWKAENSFVTDKNGKKIPVIR